MPNHRTHLTAGLVSSALLIYAINLFDASFLKSPSLIFLYACFALAGSIFPDIDIDSKMQRMFWPLITIAVGITLVFSQWHLFFILTISVLFVASIGHRTITHSVWFSLFFPLLLAWYIQSNHPMLRSIAYTSAFFFSVGAWSHIFLDRTVSKYKRYR